MCLTFPNLFSQTEIYRPFPSETTKFITFLRVVEGYLCIVFLLVKGVIVSILVCLFCVACQHVPFFEFLQKDTTP